LHVELKPTQQYLMHSTTESQEGYDVYIRNLHFLLGWRKVKNTK